MTDPTIHAKASGVILNPNILRENIPLRSQNKITDFLNDFSLGKGL